MPSSHLSSLFVSLVILKWVLSIVVEKKCIASIFIVYTGFSSTWARVFHSKFENGAEKVIKQLIQKAFKDERTLRAVTGMSRRQLQELCVIFDKAFNDHFCQNCMPKFGELT